ncbi:MAG: hypothetical protein DHS20C05_10420 [Hyphococcus sp.]|nr:MAG: hypothetical protein DHS20C05_10420 [Marinicaulis sp.]
MKHSVKILVSLFALSGCAHEVGLHDYYPEEVKAKFGEAVRQNIAAQTVNPDAPSGDGVTASGARTAIAQERYENDEVEKPRSENTRRSSGRSGSGGDSN